MSSRHPFHTLYAPDHVQLCHLLLAREERSLDKEFPENAATGPHVNRRAVALLSQEQLRGAVPQCDHTVGVKPAEGGAEEGVENNTTQWCLKATKGPLESGRI